MGVAKNLLVVAILMVLVGTLKIVVQSDIWKPKKPSKDPVDVIALITHCHRLGSREVLNQRMEASITF